MQLNADVAIAIMQIGKLRFGKTYFIKMKFWLLFAILFWVCVRTHMWVCGFTCEHLNGRPEATLSYPSSGVVHLFTLISLDRVSLDWTCQLSKLAWLWGQESAHRCFINTGVTSVHCHTHLQMWGFWYWTQVLMLMKQELTNWIITLGPYFILKLDLGKGGPIHSLSKCNLKDSCWEVWRQ